MAALTEAGVAFLFIVTAPSIGAVNAELFALADIILIPLNPTPGSRWDASPKPVEREFVRRLRSAGISTTVRDTRGREIDGACGQLAASASGPRWASTRGRERKAEQ